MGTSVIYSGIFGAVLASLPAVNTRMVVFDTAVVDLTDDLQDPVDLLFGVQLGGGTDIARALTYCQEIISRPQDTVLVLVTDLYEGGEVRDMYKRFVELVNSGVQLIVLPALNDSWQPLSANRISGCGYRKTSASEYCLHKTHTRYHTKCPRSCLYRIRPRNEGIYPFRRIMLTVSHGKVRLQS